MPIVPGNKIKVSITIECADEAQVETALKMAGTTMTGMKTYFEKEHDENLVTYQVERLSADEDGK